MWSKGHNDTKVMIKFKQGRQSFLSCKITKILKIALGYNCIYLCKCGCGKNCTFMKPLILLFPPAFIYHLLFAITINGFDESFAHFKNWAGGDI
jgi:hypothetical protein